MTAIILDNNEADINDLSFTLKQLRYNIKVNGRFRSLDSFKEFCATNHSKIDIIFTDVKFGSLNLFDHLDIVNFAENIIITTHHNDFAVHAFRHNVTDYLLKPVQVEQLNESILKVKRLKNINKNNGLPYKSQFQVTVGKQLVMVKIEEIDFIESCNKMTYIHLIGGKRIPCVIPLLTLEEKLDPECFFRANRQIIFHFDAVQTIEKSKSSKYLVKLKSHEDKVITLSEEKSKAFRAWIDR
jgi:two-component system LytT family response regulator